MTVTAAPADALPSTRVAPWAARPRTAARPDKAVVVGSMMWLPIAWIEPGPNVRGEDVGDVSELAAAIARNGQEQPMLVWQLTETRYVLIEGHRRRKAIRQAGIECALVVLRRRPGNCERIVRQLSMHTHAKPFDPLAEARALHELMFKHNLSREEIAAQVGRNPVWVRDRIALLRLTADEQDLVQRRQLPLGEALEIVRVRRSGTSAGAAAASNQGTRTGARRRREQHFTSGHELAAAAGERCQALGATHRDRALIGDVACGECWEHAIRADQATAPGSPTAVAATEVAA